MEATVIGRKGYASLADQLAQKILNVIILELSDKLSDKF